MHARFARNAGILAASFIVLYCAVLFGQSAAQEVPAANPGRPTVATPATLTPVGYLQFETGGIYAAGSAEFSSQSGINLVAKLAVASRLQLLGLTQPVAVSNDPNGRETQTGDVFAGLQAVVLPGEGAHPTVSFSYIGRIYEGPSPNTDIGTFRHCAMLLVSDDLSGFHFDINGMVTEQTDDVRLRRAQFGQTVSVSHPPGPVHRRRRALAFHAAADARQRRR